MLDFRIRISFALAGLTPELASSLRVSLAKWWVELLSVPDRQYAQSLQQQKAGDMIRTLSEGATHFSQGAAEDEEQETQKGLQSNRERCFGKPITSMLNTSRADSLKPLSSSEIYLPLMNLDKASEVFQEVSLLGEDLLKEIEIGNLPHYETLYRPLILSNMLRSQEQLVAPREQLAEKRNIVINWLILIHTRYGFQPETLHEASNIFNRFLSRNEVEEDQLERLGLTCLWMSAKMEQRSIKTLKAWLDFGRGFTLEEVIETEARVLHELDFKLSIPTTLSFFSVFSTYYSLNPRTMALCQYLVQLTLIDCRYLKYKGHVISLAAIYFALKIIGLSQWNEKIIELIQVKLQDVRECARDLCKSIQLASANKLSSIYRKYSSRQHHQVAKIRFGRKN